MGYPFIYSYKNYLLYQNLYNQKVPTEKHKKSAAQHNILESHFFISLSKKMVISLAAH